MDRACLADVRAGTLDEVVRSGSGYRIGPSLILTARHNVVADGVALPRIVVLLGHPRDRPPTRHDATLLDWHAPDGADVALLRIDAPVSPAAPARWGRMTGSDPVGYTGWGFPRFAGYGTGDRQVEQLSGMINPDSIGAGGGLPVDQHAFPDTGGHPWSGVSGAAVFGASAGLLIGVIVYDDTAFANRRLHMIPVTAFLHDQDFGRLIEDDTGLRPEIEPVELHDLLRGRPIEPRAGTPGSLLAAGQETVPFHGRGELLDELARWRDDDRPFSIKLITGEGGQGKTRLAGELLRRTPEHWITGFLGSADDDAARVLTRGNHPALIVADYAEATSHRVAALLGTLLHTPPRRNVRLLLLARTEGAWWDNLRARLEREAPHALTPAVRLTPLAGNREERQAEYERAVEVFAARLLRLPGLPQADWPALAGQVRAAPPPDLDAEAFGNALTVHMAAMNALLRASGGQEPAADPEHELAHHERAYLYRLAARRNLLRPGILSTRLDDDERRAESLRALDRAVAGLILIGQSGCDPGRASSVAALASEPYAEEVVRWLAALYPPSEQDRGEGLVLGPLLPDRLAERLLGQILAESEDTLLTRIAALARDGDGAGDVLHVLARTAERPLFLAATDARIQRLIAEVPAPYAEEAQLVALYVDRPDPLLEGLARLGAQDPAELKRRLWAVAGVFPTGAVSTLWGGLYLAELQSLLFTELAEADRDTYLPDMARSLINHGSRLADTGQFAQALAVSEQAVRHCRELVARDRAAHLHDLSTALGNHASHLSNNGRRAEPLTVSEEAVRLRRELAAGGQDANVFDLTFALNNHTAYLAELGRFAEALPAAEEALRLRRELAERDADRYLPELAALLSDYSITLTGIGRTDEACSASAESIRMHRELVPADADVYLSGLARALNRHAMALIRAGRPGEAFAGLDEAIGHLRHLTELNRTVFLDELAVALSNHAICLAETGRPHEAVTAIEEVVLLFRELVEYHRESYLHRLAGALMTRAESLVAAGRAAEALPAGREAVGHYRELAAADRDGFLADLAASLDTQARNEARAGRLEEAAACAGEAIRLFEELAGTDPGAFLDDLGQALAFSLHDLTGVAGPKERISISERLVRVRRQQAGHDRETYLPDLAVALGNHTVALAADGRYAEAVADGEEEVRLWQELVERDRDANLYDLALTYGNLSVGYSKIGRAADAVAAAEQAVLLHRERAVPEELSTALLKLASRLTEAGRHEDAIDRLRELAELDRAANLPYLARGLTDHATRLADAGRPADALAVSEEAVRLCRELPGPADPAVAADDHGNRLADLAVAADDHGNRLADLAVAVNNHGNRLADLGRFDEAVTAGTEAVRLRRDLDEPDRVTYLAELASALNNLAGHLAGAARPGDVVPVSEEVVRCYRELAGPGPGTHLPDPDLRNPGAYLPELATSLGNHANALAEAGHLPEAVAAGEESIRLHRALAAGDRARYVRDLAMALNDQGGRLADTGRIDEALSADEEAVRLHREAAGLDPGADPLHLAGSLFNLSVHLARAGRPHEARPAAEESVRLYETLVEADPDAYVFEYAQSLGAYGSVLVTAGLHREAVMPLVAAFGVSQQIQEAGETLLPLLVHDLTVAYRGDPEGVVAEFEAVTGEAFPDWIR
ncbi:tetratricopeptide repeat protein [Nonomuraea sp. PA05]|uniref:tetratricopeptide repeat protein n=1 Tax=Nonomuraea sp. PA05 TaxID=2604466 RepID=UPI0011D9AE99|nr:tetratricopeptide repeat protein [Nonomuraea sp. PA05]TYB51120.1 tetratricopeptide repeat protein [Nonomuraea sp. PA05]